MSVFTDFQKAWVQRFPGCELPQAWEDDVRANLTKHRQKVAVLREELEKEEFYVEYLERLLADVERVKRQNIVKPLNDNILDQNGGRKDENKNVEEECDTNLDYKLQASTEQTTHFENLNEASKFSVDKTESPFNSLTKKESNIKTEKVSSVKECDSYVTVIEVGGENTVTEKAKALDNTKIESLSTTKTSENKQTAFVTFKEASFTESKQTKPADGAALSDTQPQQPLQEIEKPIFSVLPIAKKRPPPLPPPKKVKKATSLTETTTPDITSPPTSVTKHTFSTFKPFSASTEPTNQTPVLDTHKITNEELVPNKGQNQAETTQKSPMRDTQEESVDFSEETSLESPTNQKEESLPANGEFAGSKSNSMEALESEYEIIPKDGFDISMSRESLPMDSLPEALDSPDSSTYMNIDYFLKNPKPKLSMDGSLAQDSEEEDAYTPISISSDPEPDGARRKSLQPSVKDEVFEVDSGDSQLNGAPPPIPPLKPSAPEEADLKAEAERLAMYKCIIANIVESETIYVESLSLLLQYMKALRSTIDTSQPLLSKDDFQLIFFKIPELQALHDTFLKGLRAKSESWNSHTLIGDDFKVLASRLGVYAAFLQNYSRAIETVRRCSTSNSKFQEITKTIKLKSQQGQATNLEDLLHKPVARVQKNALVLHDLLRYTPASHPDAKTLKTALKMTQCFLNDLNLAAAAESMFPAMDKAQRHLVKNSFIVELSDGHRKLRHLFLFNDVIVCAKCKPSNRQKFTFEIKWYIPLAEVVLPPGEAEVKEVSPQDVLSLKSRASTFRDHILKEESNQKTNNRSVDKHKKKLSELEGQLVLASPMLPFRVGHKSRTYTFFLSSEFERAQWVEAISILQLSAPAATAPLSSYELQAWISSCRKHLGSSLGSFLFRTGKDEDLLVGDLAITVYSLHGMTRPADVYLCFEVDSYGHFFNKATTKVSHNTTEAQFNQDFVLELEGSQSLRILLYECTARNPILRGKAALELTGGWLSVRMQEKSVALQDFMLSLGLKFQPGTASLGPPSGGRGTLFGIKIQQVCKKEKSAVPFLIRLCVREVERRGMTEVGIYRVSGSTADVAKLRKAFETIPVEQLNLYTGEQLLKETDIHTVTGLLKMFLRELPEPLFTDLLHAKFLSAFNTNSGRGEEQQEEKQRQLVTLFNSLPQVNQNVINFLLDHMLRVHRAEAKNKMSLHNLATVFGPTMLRQPENSGQPSSSSDLLTAGTVDVMAQAGILYFFLCRRQRTAQL